MRLEDIKVPEGCVLNITISGGPLASGGQIRFALRSGETLGIRATRTAACVVTREMLVRGIDVVDHLHAELGPEPAPVKPVHDYGDPVARLSAVVDRLGTLRAPAFTVATIAMERE